MAALENAEYETRAVIRSGGASPREDHGDADYAIHGGHANPVADRLEALPLEPRPDMRRVDQESLTIQSVTPQENRSPRAMQPPCDRHPTAIRPPSNRQPAASQPPCDRLSTAVSAC